MCFESLDNCGDPNFAALTLCDTEGGCPNGGTCNVDAGNERWPAADLLGAPTTPWVLLG